MRNNILLLDVDDLSKYKLNNYLYFIQLIIIIFLFSFLLGGFRFVSGVVNRERVPAFERMLWRISRGNVFLRQAELDEPLEDPNTVRKYLIIFKEGVFNFIFIVMC